MNARHAERARRAFPRGAWERGTALCALLALCLVGCDQRMDNQPKYEPLEASAFFPDHKSARDLVPGTVPRGFTRVSEFHYDDHYYLGLVDGEPAETVPARLLDEWPGEPLLARGRARYHIFCVPCHGMLGNGDGLVPQRGYPYPPTFHKPDLRDKPVGYIYRIIMDGKGRMPEYGKQIPPDDRWAIAAYVKALQLSQYALVPDLPEPDQQTLQELPGL